MVDILWGMGGMVVLLALAVALSVDRRAIRLRTVGAALALQVAFAVIVLYVPAGRAVLDALTRGVQAVIDSSSAGISFLFLIFAALMRCGRTGRSMTCRRESLDRPRCRHRLFSVPPTSFSWTCRSCARISQHIGPWSQRTPSHGLARSPSTAAPRRTDLHF